MNMDNKNIELGESVGIHSRWVLRTNAKNEKNASVLLNRVAKILEVAPARKCFTPNGAQGFTIEWSVIHNRENWSDTVVDALQLAQRIGSSWVITGDIAQQCHAWSNRSRVAGVQLIQWSVKRHLA
jgi:hypothetical protein